MKENMRKRVNNLEENRQQPKKDLGADLSALTDEELELLERVVTRSISLSEQGHSLKEANRITEEELSREEKVKVELAINKIIYK